MKVRERGIVEGWECDYLDSSIAHELYVTYDNILGKLVTMICHPEQWVIETRR